MKPIKNVSCMSRQRKGILSEQKWKHFNVGRTKTRRRQDSSYVRHFTSLRRHIVFLEIVALVNSKKNRNIKANDVNLIWMVRSTDFCFKITYVGMFLCFRSSVHCFQCFVRGSSPFGKKFPVNPPYPTEITTFKPPSPLEFPMIFRGGWGGGYGYFLELHIII